MTVLTFGRVVAGAAVAIAAVWVMRALEGIYEPTGMDGKVVLITGGSTGLGLESAKRLAKAGAKVVITARNDVKGQKAVAAIQGYTNGKAEASYKVLELEDLESTKAAAKWDLPAIDVLMLNAGILAVPKLELTELGIERQMHTNHLGHFVFTASVESFLKRDARIIVVSSLGHKIPMLFGGLDLDYAWKPTEKTYSPFLSYGNSKLANVYFASKLDSMSGYTVVSLHPGNVATQQARRLTDIQLIQQFMEKILIPVEKSLGFVLTPEQGANTQIYLASTTDELVGGGYYESMKPQKLGGFATDPAMADLLWKQSEEISGVNFSF